jgi:magnesium-transporting ATPase (P-type)
MALTSLEKVKPPTVAQENGRATSWHALTKENVLLKLRTRLNGLSDEQVNQRQQEFGLNTLPGKRPPTLGTVFFRQFLSPLIYILLAASGMSFLLGEIKEALFIFGVVLLNAGVGMYQEWQEARSAAALPNLLKIYARVQRGGSEWRITADELVPGDIVQLEPGDRVPADLRLMRTHDLTIDESVLTGESLAVTKNAAPLAEANTTGARSNMAFAGSTVISGRGVGVVVATGRRTEMSRIVETVTSVEMAPPPFALREQVARQTGLMVLGAGSLLAMIVLAKGTLLNEVLSLAVALAVSAIPAGLPLAILMTLSIATVRMAKRAVLVRRLTAVESLGSCTYIASDKTGALTMNQPTVKSICLPSGESFTLSDEGYGSKGEVLAAKENPGVIQGWSRLKHLVRVAILCNEAQLVYREGALSDQGDAIDVAFLAVGYKLGPHPRLVRGEVKTVGMIPFELERGYAAYFYQDKSRVKVAVKGAFEIVLPLCQRMLTRRGLMAVDPAMIEQEARTLAENGYQVLAVAEGEVVNPAELTSVTEENIPPLTLLGLVGLIDPLRPEVKSAVEKCRRAGIEMTLLTGDHPATALALARELGIAAFRQHVVTGHQLAQIGPIEASQFLEMVKSARVFARVTPRQKLQIVESLVKLGHVVAVTGAGIKDAPALRRANIGVALKSSTEVAKATAAIIVAGNGLTSLATGIEAGRFAHDNVHKATYLLFSTGAAEVILFALALLTDLPLPLFVGQLLWLNLVINGIQGVALAFEAGEPGAMTRRPTGRIFNKRMMQQTMIAGATMGLISSATWYGLRHAGWDEAAARNLVLLLMVLFQNFHMFNCGSEQVSAFKTPLRRNILLGSGVIAALGLHLLAMQTPFTQALLNIAPVSLPEFIYLLLLASPILFVMELFKRIGSFGRRKKPNSDM